MASACAGRARVASSDEDEEERVAVQGILSLFQSRIQAEAADAAADSYDTDDDGSGSTGAPRGTRGSGSGGCGDDGMESVSGGLLTLCAASTATAAEDGITVRGAARRGWARRGGARRGGARRGGARCGACVCVWGGVHGCVQLDVAQRKRRAVSRVERARLPKSHRTTLRLQSEVADIAVGVRDTVTIAKELYDSIASIPSNNGCRLYACIKAALPLVKNRTLHRELTRAISSDVWRKNAAGQARSVACAALYIFLGQPRSGVRPAVKWGALVAASDVVAVACGDGGGGGGGGGSGGGGGHEVVEDDEYWEDGDDDEDDGPPAPRPGMATRSARVRADAEWAAGALVGARLSAR